MKLSVTSTDMSTCDVSVTVCESVDWSLNLKVKFKVTSTRDVSCDQGLCYCRIQARAHQHTFLGSVILNRQSD